MENISISKTQIVQLVESQENKMTKPRNESIQGIVSIITKVINRTLFLYYLLFNKCFIEF